MESECKLLGTCGFFRKYRVSKELACKGFIAMYCRGPKQKECKRLERHAKFGACTNDDMMPNGLNCVQKIG